MILLARTTPLDRGEEEDPKGMSIFIVDLREADRARA